MKRRLLALFIGAITLIGSILPAVAAEEVICTVFTVEAGNQDSGIDEGLKQFKSVFAQKPFDTFTSFKLISEKSYTLQLDTPATLSLPSQLKGSIEYKGNMNQQLKLNLNLSKGSAAPIHIQGTASNGVPFMAAGYKSPNGRWVIAIQCKK